MAKVRGQLSPAVNIAVFLLVFAVFEVVDRLTKMYFDSNFMVGEGFDGPIPSVINFVLVHNTGGAWGMFSDSTIALGVFALVVSVVLAVFALRYNEGATWVETVCLAMVVAGGFGNAVDRFALQYVVDFLNFGFIDFPVFNVADIGVTVGMVVFFLALAVRTVIEEKNRKKEAASEVTD